MIAKAEPLIEKALELDAHLGEAYTTRASIQQMRFDFEGAASTYRRALELNPNYARAYRAYGDLLSWTLGRPEEGLILQRKSVELDPLSAIAINVVGQAHLALGRFDEELSWYEKALEVDPDSPLTLWTIGMHKWLVSSNYSEAVRWFKKAISSNPGDPWVMAHFGRLFLDLGDLDQAEYWIHQSIELGPESFAPNLAMQLLHLHNGDEFGSSDYGRRVLLSGRNGHCKCSPFN
jgi:tetratricopeptide (TPR) repeat protein